MTSFIPINDPKIRFHSSGYLTKSGAFYTPEQAQVFIWNLPAFHKWYIKMESTFGDDFHGVNIVSIYPFVNEKLPLGFVFVDADVYRNGKPIPGGAFLRGASVSILLFLVALENTQRRFVVRTLQSRVPIGEKEYEESVAGMVDAGTFKGAAAKELEEETSLVIHENELVSLGSFVPSAGGCDEEIEVFRVVKTMPLMEILALKGKLTGSPAENEQIRLCISTEQEYIRDIKEKRITDGKALASLALHLLHPL